MSTQRQDPVEAREQLAAIVDSSVDAIIGKTVDGIVTSWNKAAQRLYGYTADEMVGHSIEKLIPSDQPNELPKLMERIRRGERVEHYETTRKRKDGSLIQVSLAISPIRNAQGVVVGAAVIARDITDLAPAAAERARHAALEESEERFRAVAEMAGDAIISADEKGIVTYLNQSAQRMFALAPPDILGKPLTTLMPERFHAPHTAGLARYLRTGEAKVIGKTVELVGRRKDGSEFPVELSIASWKANKGLFFTGILRDITDRKRVETELSQRTKDLASAYSEMEAFAYTVSHDLRAPLRAVQGYSQALLEDYGGRLDDKGKQYLHRLIIRAERMDRMLIDVLDYSRLGRGRLNMKGTDLRAVVDQVLSTLEPAISEKGARITVAPKLGAVWADGDLLARLLVNLVQNAIKFTDAEKRADVEIGADRTAGFVRLWVRDNGIGIALENQGRIWGVLERLHGSEKYPGTGIGLAIVKRGAERMGGRVGVSSRPGVGSLFWIELPGAAGGSP